MGAQNYSHANNPVPIAGPGARLVAWLIDAVMCAIPALVTFGVLAYGTFNSLRFFGDVSPFQALDEILRLIAQNMGQYFYIPLLTLAVWGLVAVINSVLGGMSGQTLGRKIAGTRLVAADSYEPLGGDRALVRGVIFNAINAVPVAGQLLNVIVILSDSNTLQGPADRATKALVVKANFDPAVTRMHAATAAGPAPAAHSPLARNLEAPRQPTAPPAPLPPWLDRPGPQTPPAPRPAAPPPPAAPAVPSRPQSPVPPVPPVPPRPAPAAGPTTPVAVPQVPAGPTSTPDANAQGRATSSEIDAEVEMTRLVPAGQSRRAYRPSEPDPVRARIRVSDGQVVDIRGVTLVGRNPAPRPNERAAKLLSVHDPQRSVSKTHLALGLDERGLWVVDRTSTNGSVVTLADGQQIVCMPEQEVRVSPGAKIQLGDVAITVLPV